MTKQAPDLICNGEYPTRYSVLSLKIGSSVKLTWCWRWRCQTWVLTDLLYEWFVFRLWAKLWWKIYIYIYTIVYCIYIYTTIYILLYKSNCCSMEVFNNNFAAYIWDNILLLYIILTMGMATSGIGVDFPFETCLVGSWQLKPNLKGNHGGGFIMKVHI